MAFVDMSLDRQREINARQRALENQIAQSFVEGGDEARKSKREAALRAAEIAREDQLRNEQRMIQQQDQDYSRNLELAKYGIAPDAPKVKNALGQEVMGPPTDKQTSQMSIFDRIAQERKAERESEKQDKSMERKIKNAQYREQFGEFEGSRKQQEMLAQAEIDKAKAMMTLKNPEIKQNQDVAAGFSRRARLATQELASLPKDYGSSIISSTLQGSGLFPEGAKSEDRKVFEQAERNFISAVLRKESGASISPQEYANEQKKYFAQPGDTPKVLAQKERAREQAILNLEAEAGNALAKGQTVIAPAYQDGGVMGAVANENPYMSVDEGSLMRRREELLKKRQ